MLLTGGVPLLCTWLLLSAMGGAGLRGESLLAALVFSAPAVRWAAFATVLEIAHGGASRAAPRDAEGAVGG